MCSCLWCSYLSVVMVAGDHILQLCCSCMCILEGNSLFLLLATVLIYPFTCGACGITSFSSSAYIHWAQTTRIGCSPGITDRCVARPEKHFKPVLWVKSGAQSLFSRKLIPKFQYSCVWRVVFLFSTLLQLTLTSDVYTTY